MKAIEFGSTECRETDLFAVEVCSDAAGVLPSVPERYFSTIDKAKAYFSSTDGKFCWISEWGTYRTRSGSLKETWFYFWWSPGTDYGVPNERGCGVRCDARSVRAVEYWPYDPAYVPSPGKARSIRELEA